MSDPEGERLGNRFLVGEAALGPLSLELPVQIGGQPNRRFKRRTGAHTIRLLKFGLFDANAGRRVNRVHPANRPPFPRERLCSSIRTAWNPRYTRFIRSQSWMQGICSEFGTKRRSNPGCGGISGPLRGQFCDAGAGCPEKAAVYPDVNRQDRRGAAPPTNCQALNIIAPYCNTNSDYFSVWLLANHWYLLYKV